MVDLIPIRKLYQYASLQRQDLPEGRRYIYGEQKLPSVTTVLSATKKDKGALDAWVKRVGEVEADRIKNEAGLGGTYLRSTPARRTLLESTETSLLSSTSSRVISLSVGSGSRIISASLQLTP